MNRNHFSLSSNARLIVTEIPESCIASVSSSLNGPCRSSHSVSCMSASFPSLISTTFSVPILRCVSSSSFLLQILYAGCVSSLAVWNSVFFIVTAKAESVSAKTPSGLWQFPSRHAPASSPSVSRRWSSSSSPTPQVRYHLRLHHKSIEEERPSDGLRCYQSQRLGLPRVQLEAVGLLNVLRGLGCVLQSPVLRELGCVLQSPVLRGLGCVLQSPVLRGLGCVLESPVLRELGCVLQSPVLRELGCVLESPVLRELGCVLESRAPRFGLRRAVSRAPRVGLRPAVPRAPRVGLRPGCPARQRILQQSTIQLASRVGAR